MDFEQSKKKKRQKEKVVFFFFLRNEKKKRSICKFNKFVKIHPLNLSLSSGCLVYAFRQYCIK